MPIPNDTRVRELLSEAMAQTAEERQAFLDTVCGGNASLRAEVQALLLGLERAGEAAGGPTVDMPVPAVSADLPREPSSGSAAKDEGPGKIIGRYKLLQLIGEGGFGSVFMAEQEQPVRRRVALKIIKLGMDTKQVIARFEAERQALAMMDHAHIARVFDAGATNSGRPYFVMELVKGVPITEYCDSQNLSTRERLELFIPVCNAVQHAHQKGIIHRDIKPSNVMVTMADGKPVPKVIDFGIAKATNARLTEQTYFTEYRQFIGTPQYMSPEQAGMSGIDIDTRSDIYSLGVLLYELLTGTTPLDARELRSQAYEEMRRIIREAETPRPSTKISGMGDSAAAIAQHRKTEPGKLGQLLRGELDWIVMRALEKDRTRRYDTPGNLAMDIQRHLTNQPVEARPVSATYRMRKFIRRNKGRVTAAGLLLFALIGGTAGTSWGLVNARWALHKEAAAHERTTVAMLAEYQAHQRETVAMAAEITARQRETLALKQSRDRLVQTSIIRGLEAINAGDHGAALNWWIRALGDETDPQRQRVLRSRIALGLGQMPRMRQLLIHSAPLCFTEDGKQLVCIDRRLSRSKSDGLPLVRRDLMHPRTVSFGAPPASGGVTGAPLSGLGSVVLLKDVTELPLASNGTPSFVDDKTTPVRRLVRTNPAQDGMTLTFWDVPRLKALGTTAKQSSPPIWTGYSADGSHAALLFAIAGEKSRFTIQGFDVNTGLASGPPISLSHHQPRMPNPWVQISAAGDRIATVTDSDHSPTESGVEFSADVWEVATGKSIFHAPFGASLEDVNQIGYGFGQAILSPDGNRLLTLWGPMNTAIRLWDVRTGEPVSDEQFLGFNNCVGFGPVGGFLTVFPDRAHPDDEKVWVYQNNSVALRIFSHRYRCWTCRDLVPEDGADADAHVNQVFYPPVGYSTDGALAAFVRTQDGGAEVRLWDIRRLGVPARRAQINCVGASVDRVLFSADSRRVAIAFASDMTQIRDTRPPGAEPSFSTVIGEILAISPDGRRTLSQFLDHTGVNTLEIYDRLTRKSVFFSSPFHAWLDVMPASFSPDGSCLVLAGWPASTGRGRGCQSIVVLRANDGGPIVQPFQPLPEDATAQCRLPGFTSDGEWFFADCYGQDQSAGVRWRVWNATTGAEFGLPDAEYLNMGVACFSDDSRLVLMASNFGPKSHGDEVSWVCDFQRRTRCSPPLRRRVEYARFSPDARFVLIFDGSDLAMYEIATAREVWSSRTEIRDFAPALAFSPDGSKIAVSGRTVTEIRLASDGSLLPHPINSGVGRRGQRHDVGSIRFSEDGLLLIFWLGDRQLLDMRTTQIFDVRTGEMMASISLPRGYLGTPTFPDAARMLLGSQHGLVEITFAPDMRPASTLETIIHLLSGRKLNINGILVPLTADETVGAWNQLIADGEPEVGEDADAKPSSQP